jgi:hypothetical protein
MAEEQGIKQESVEAKIASLAVRYSAKYRVAKTIEDKLNLSTALTLLSIAQGLEPKFANKVVMNAKIIGKG